MTRCFVFGCSMTKYVYATWADYLGVNFSEYYNCGLEGGCNTYIANRVVEVKEKYKFNPNTDFVAVGMTAIPRISFYSRELPSHSTTHGWVAKGNVYEYAKESPNDEFSKFVNKYLTYDWFMYQSYINLKIIRQALSNIPHVIFNAVGTGLINNIISDSNQIIYKEYITDTSKNNFNGFSSEAGLAGWKVGQYTPVTWQKTNFTKSCWTDPHPTQEIHYKFFTKMFSKYATEKSQHYYNKVQHILNTNDRKEASKTFNNFQKNYRKFLDLTCYEI